MKTLPLFLAWRFLWFKGKDKNISFMIKTCFLSIFIGTFALMVTLIIMNGFEKVIHEKMQGINADLIISSAGNRLDYENIRTTLMHEFAPIVYNVSGCSTKQVLIDHHQTRSILFLKGVDPEQEEHVSTIATKIIQPTIQHGHKNILMTLLRDNHILIGYKMAQSLNVGVGDSIDLLIPEPGSKNKIFLKKKKGIIAGILKVGFEEYDSNFALTSLTFVNKLFKEQGVDQVNIKLIAQPHPLRFKIPAFASLTSRSWWNSLTRRFVALCKQVIGLSSYRTQSQQALKRYMPHLEIVSWQELYPDLVSSLILEKYVMFFILALITLVATLNMISLLFMQIQSKLRDIAIIKALGLANKRIRSVFLIMGLTITLLASLSGLCAAALVGTLLERYPFITLPDVYYVSHLPARMDTPIFLAVFLITLVLGFIATWIPAQRIYRINISRVLRQE